MRIVSDEKSRAPNVSNQMSQSRQRDSHTIVSTCSSAQLIKDHEGSLCSVLDDVTRVPQFHLKKCLIPMSDGSTGLARDGPWKNKASVLGIN